jgi:hypothetical protein
MEFNHDFFNCSGVIDNECKCPTQLEIAYAWNERNELLRILAVTKKEHQKELETIRNELFRLTYTLLEKQFKCEME